MNTKRGLLAGLIIVLAMTSCKKEEVENSDNPPVDNQISMKQRSQDFLESKKQVFTVDAASPTVLTGNQGTRIYLDGNNFADAQGNPVSGNVQLELVEIYKKSEMVLLNKSTLATNGGGMELISSGGEFYITAAQNGQALEIANPLTVETAGTNAPNWTMQLFDGTTNSAGDITWAASVGDSLTIAVDSLQDYFYSFPFDGDFSWINCDYFWDNPSIQTGVTVNVPTVCDGTNTIVYLVFTSENAAASLYNYSNNAFSTGASYSIPEGLDVYFVVITDDNGQLKYAVQNNTISTNHVETITTLTDVNSMAELEVIFDGMF